MGHLIPRERTIHLSLFQLIPKPTSTSLKFSHERVLVLPTVFFNSFGQNLSHNLAKNLDENRAWGQRSLIRLCPPEIHKEDENFRKTWGAFFPHLISPSTQSMTTLEGPTDAFPFSLQGENQSSITHTAGNGHRGTVSRLASSQNAPFTERPWNTPAGARLRKRSTSHRANASSAPQLPAAGPPGPAQPCQPPSCQTTPLEYPLPSPTAALQWTLTGLIVRTDVRLWLLPIKRGRGRGAANSTD